MSNGIRKNLAGIKIHEFRTRAGQSYQDLSEALESVDIILTEKDIKRIEGGDRPVTDIELNGFMQVFHCRFSDLIDMDAHLPDDLYINE